MKNYLTYPCEVLRITQSYTGATSHLPHTTGYPKDYPWDEGCADGGRSKCYCPCDEMKVKRIYGVGSRGTNTLWLESTSKVVFADGTEDFFTMLITHPNDSDLEKIKVGDKFVRGQFICSEGKDGATGNHLHFSAGKGLYKGTGWTKNSKGKYVLTTTAGAYKPEQLFYINKKFTKVVNDRGLGFKKLPEQVEYKTGAYIVEADGLNVRKGPGTQYGIVKYSEMTLTAQLQVLRKAKKKRDCFVKNCKFTVTQVKDNWGKCKSGWLCLDYCRKL